MAISDKWIAGGTIDVSSGITAIPKAYKVGKVPGQNAQMSFGYYVKTHWTEAEEQPSLMDTTYGYCATDGNFCANTGVLWNCGYSNPSFNRYKRYDLTSSAQNAIGFGRFYPDKGTYANIGIYGGTGASSYKDDASNTPLSNYLNGKNARNTATFSSKPQVYGRNLTPVVEGFSLKDVMYVPVIMAYRLASGVNPVAATKAEMQAYYYRLSSIDAYENVEYQNFPYIMGVYMQPVFMNIENKTVSTGFTNGFTGFCNGEYKITTGVYDESGGQKEQTITYYPLYGDNNSTETTLDGWYEWRPEETDPTKRSKWASHPSMHPLCIMGYGSNGSEWNKQFIRVDGSGNYASGGKLILTGDWLKTDLLEVSSSEKWVKIYSDTITEANVHDFCEYVRRQAAYMGGFFRCDGRLDLIDYRLIDEGTYMGVIDGSGITHGDYTKGVENAKNPSFDWTDAINDTNFKPGGGGPTSGGDHDKEQSSYGGDNFSMNDRTMAKFGLHRYVMEEGEFDTLMQFYKECLDYKGARKKYIDFLVDKGVSSDDAAELWNAWFPDRSSYLAQMYGDLGYGEDPHKNLVSILALPVDKTEIQGSEENINTGYYTTAKTFTLNTTLRSGASYDVPYAPVTDGFAATAHVLNSTVKVIDLVRDHKIEHPKGWDDFRCYEPYSRCELYIPYHGNVTLSLAQCLNKYITVQVAVDLISGASYAVVLMRGSSGPYAIYQALPGQMGFNVPYSQDSSGYNAGSLMNLSAASQSNKIEKYRNVANALVATGSAIAGKNAFGAVGSVLGGIATGQQLDVQSDLIDFQIEHSADGRAVANSPSTLTGWAVHQTCQLIWHFPNMLAYNDANYANLVGYATARTGAVGSFKGFTKFNNVNLSALTCLDEERNAIMAALQSGVYL